MQIHEIDFNKNWLATDSKGNLWVAPKDPHLVRWIKYLVQCLFCGCVRAFDHIRIDRVAKAIIFQYNKETDEKKRDHYRILVDKLICSKRPIRTYRMDLIRLQAKIAKKKPLVQLELSAGKQFIYSG